MRYISNILLSLLVLMSVAVAQDNRGLERDKVAGTEKRLALVIGNGAYQNARTLANPVNDATDIANTLSSLGFEVIYGVDLNLKQMSDKVRDFGDKLKVNGGVGLFYYAGHGVQVGGRNYLIPVEANILREDEVQDAALNFDLVLRKMATANNGFNIVVLDACRNNPFARSWSRSADEGGLAQINAPTGSFIAYATSPDRTASDGTGRNGLYTAELLRVLPDPTLKIEDAFKRVTIAVDKASSGNQIPWTSSSLRGEFYFKVDEKNAKLIKDAQATSVTFAPPVSEDTAAWNKIKDINDPEALSAFMQKFPNSPYAQIAAARLRQYASDPLGMLDRGGSAASNPPAYLVDGENRTQLKVAATKQDYNVKTGVMGYGGGVKYVTAFNGGRSQTRAAKNPPEFEITLADGSVNVSDVIFVLKLKSKSDIREIQGMQKTFSGFKKEDTITATFQEMPAVEGKREKVYRVKFSGPLSPGEYAIYFKGALMGAGSSILSRMQMAGVDGGGTFYDFGIDAK